MGIRSLTKFMKDNYKKWRLVNPLEGGLIIDGYSLLYEIFLSSNADWVHGGQYWLFRNQLLEFFQCLEKSNIFPIVILDGCDYKGEKERVRRDRMEKSITTIENTLTGKNEKSDRDIIPMLSQEAFTCVLEELKIPFYVADGEADPVIVAMANYYKYPVLGNDSDYFMFNIECGHIPLDRLHWDTQPITAELYKLGDFLNVYGISTDDIRLSRVIPSILGNDYILPAKEILKLILRRNDMNSQKKFVACLVEYIAKFQSVDDLIQSISANPRIADSLRTNVEKAVELYDIADTISEQDLAYVESTALTPSAAGKKIPRWIIAQYRRGHFDRSIMQGLVTGKCYCSYPIDDPDKPSAQLPSSRIRQSIFTILSELMKKNTITEVFRCGDILVSEEMVCQEPDMPDIYSIPKKTKIQRVKVLCQVLKVDPKLLEPFDDKWKLVVAAGCYWVRECSPSEHLISSLVLCLTLCNQSHYPVSLSPWFVYPKDRTSKWMDALHQFSSFQCIYSDIAKLNDILKNPLPFLSPAFLFDGQLAQFFACEKGLLGLIERGFKSSSVFLDLYQTFSSFMPTIPESSAIHTTGATIDSTETAHSTVNTTTKPPAHMRNNPFAMLMELDSEEDDSDCDN